MAVPQPPPARSGRRPGEVALQYREGLAASAIAIAIEAANYAFFKHSEAGSQLALTVAIVGVLLALLRSALQLYVTQAVTPLRSDVDKARVELVEALQPVRKLTEVMDLQAELNVTQLRSLIQRYSGVIEAEFRPVKEQIVNEATEQLRRLAIEKRSATLQSADYYDWLFRQFDSLGAGAYVHAVSLSSDSEWNDSQLEKNFFAKNLAAAERGVHISRLFIIERQRLPEFVKLPPIKAHTVEAQTGLDGFFIPRDLLERADRDYLASVGEGFIDFNGHVGLEDRFDPDGRARGEVTMLRADLDKMLRIYERLLNMGEPLSSRMERSVPGSTTT